MEKFTDAAIVRLVDVKRNDYHRIMIHIAPDTYQRVKALAQRHGLRVTSLYGDLISLALSEVTTDE